MKTDKLKTDVKEILKDDLVINDTAEAVRKLGVALRKIKKAEKDKKIAQQDTTYQNRYAKRHFRKSKW